jgi:hypothetical protein
MLSGRKARVIQLRIDKGIDFGGLIKEKSALVEEKRLG